MKRDPRLHGLSSDHHHALVLARRIRIQRDAGQLDRELVAEAALRFRDEIEPHFQVEEEELLPAIAAAGRGDLQERTLADHRAIRGCLAAAKAGETEQLAEFGSRLEAHVRFEESELFPACERLAGDEVLDRIAERAPHSQPKVPPVSRP